MNGNPLGTFIADIFASITDYLDGFRAHSAIGQMLTHMPVDSNLTGEDVPPESNPKPPQGTFWDDWKLIRDHKQDLLEARPEGIKIIDDYFDQANLAIFGTTFIKPSWWTELLKYMVVFQTIHVTAASLFIMVLMVEIFGFVWVLAVFLTGVYLFFPWFQFLFLFNLGFQKNLVTKERFWAVWFYLLLQIWSMVTLADLMIGNFARYFEIPITLGSVLAVIYQAVQYAFEIIWFAAYVVSLSIDYGLLL